MFVRPIAGKYSLQEELDRLRSLPRVLKGKEMKFNDGPQTFSRHYIEPVDGLGQTLHIHLEEYAPGGKNGKHGHVNEVHNNCVHQHFNASLDKPARALVIKSKPMYMFMNMLFQKRVERRPTEPAPGAENFAPRESEQDFNHPK
jgi:hypothetical protein